jgi:hypothetical protein
VTTGSYLTGPCNVFPMPLFHSTKRWSGGNGRSITGRYSRKSQWNAYEMAHAKYSSTQLNKIGTRNTPNGAITIRDNNTFGAIHGSYSTAPVPVGFPTAAFSGYFDTRQELALLAKLRGKIVGHSYDMGVSLAETDKFAKTVCGTLGNLSLSVVDLLSGRWANAARRLGTSPPSRKKVRALQITDISGRYLEMRYAWMPTISDAFEASKAFEALSNGPRQKVFKASRNTGGSEYVNCNYCRVLTEVEVRRTYTYEMYEELSAARQLGLANPLTIVWERIPFSFVVDWFMPIGSYLSLIGQIPFMKGRWMRSDSLRRSYSGTFPCSTVASGGFYPGPPYPNVNGVRFNLLRTILSSPPSVPFPNLKVHGAVQGVRVWNAIALAHQIFSAAVAVPFNRGYKSRQAVRAIDALEERVSRPYFLDSFGE